MDEVETYGTLLQEIHIYRKNIDEVEFPDEMEKLLDKYEKNPSDELRDIIESQYSVETIKKASFAAGCFYTEMNSPIGKIRRFCIRKNIEWVYVKFGLILFLILGFILYNSCFRYKYRTYKGNYNQVQVIKIDTLTGKSTMSYPDYVEKEK